MSERLLSLGLDVGTTSTQMVLSQLTIENKASAFAVPEMKIVDRKILYQSPVYVTPLLDESRMDAKALRELVEAEYRRAGIAREDVDTGAVIVTGETSRKENARAVLEALSDLAGDFVVTAAGPDLESVLAAKGAGADALSEQLEQDVLHIDIGGGTSNLCLLRRGKVIRTGCLNVGGRLIRMDARGRVTYVSPVLEGLFPIAAGEVMTQETARALGETLTRGLEMAAGRLPPEELLARLQTREAQRPWEPPEGEVVLSFSGGVADCMETAHPFLAFGDVGPELGQAIRKSRLCRGNYVLGKETIRATVIGAGSHSTQLSGSTVFCQNIPLPLKNLPVLREEEGDVREEELSILAIPGIAAPSYSQVIALAEKLLPRMGKQALVCLERDMAKALGQALAARMPPDARILCIDGIAPGSGSYLDVGAPVGGAFPVVIKTLVFGKQPMRREL